MKKSILFTLLTAPAMALGAISAPTSANLSSVPLADHVKRADTVATARSEFLALALQGVNVNGVQQNFSAGFLTFLNTEMEQNRLPALTVEEWNHCTSLLQEAYDIMIQYRLNNETVTNISFLSEPLGLIVEKVQMVFDYLQITIFIDPSGGYKLNYNGSVIYSNDYYDFLPFDRVSRYDEKWLINETGYVHPNNVRVVGKTDVAPTDFFAFDMQNPNHLLINYSDYGTPLSSDGYWMKKIKIKNSFSNGNNAIAWFPTNEYMSVETFVYDTYFEPIYDMNFACEDEYFEFYLAGTDGSGGTFHVMFDEAPFSVIDSSTVVVEDCIVDNWRYDSLIVDGGTKNIYLDVDNNYTQEQIVAEVSAEDLFGVAVPVTVKTSDYEAGKTGVFNIILEATDEYGQKAAATLIVNVGDYAKPTIVKKNEVIYTYGTALTESMLLQNFTFSDNMGTAGLTYSFTYPTGFDISKPLVFGNYSLTVTATDAYNNSTSLDFILSVVDETMPVITKKDGQMSDKVGIAYSALSENTVAWILSLYKATDAIDGNCAVYLKEGKIPSGIVGDFSLLIAAKDKSNNEALATITCEIIADIPPVFILSDKLVNSTVDNPLTLEQVEQVVRNGLLRSVRATNVAVNANGYLANSTKVGSYPISYTYTDMDTNETKTDSFIMKVTDNSELPVDEPKDNWFVDAFKTVFSKNIDKATATDWVVVIGTFVLGIALIALIVCLTQPKKQHKHRNYRKR